MGCSSANQRSSLPSSANWPSKQTKPNANRKTSLLHSSGGQHRRLPLHVAPGAACRGLSRGGFWEERQREAPDVGARGGGAQGGGLALALVPPSPKQTPPHRPRHLSTQGKRKAPAAHPPHPLPLRTA